MRGAGCARDRRATCRGGRLAELSAESLNALDGLLPPHWSHQNPIDVLGDALNRSGSRRSVDLAIGDPATDGPLAILAPQAMAGPAPTAEHLKPYAFDRASR